jgi:hypothetical protein
MEKYYFFVNAFEIDPLTPHINKYIGQKKVIKYKCLICGYDHEWDETWSDEKKAEVKAEVDAHHNEHIVSASSGN